MTIVDRIIRASPEVSNISINAAAAAVTAVDADVSHGDEYSPASCRAVHCGRVEPEVSSLRQRETVDSCRVFAMDYVLPYCNSNSGNR